MAANEITALITDDDAHPYYINELQEAGSSCGGARLSPQAHRLGKVEKHPQICTGWDPVPPQNRGETLELFQFQGFLPGCGG